MSALSTRSTRGVLVLIMLGAPLFAHALVNINTAGSTELQTLNGIGPSKAAAIIAYRDTNGPFQTVEDIKKVSGIGDVTFSNIKDYITIGSAEDNLATSTQATSTAAENSASESASINDAVVTISTHYSAAPLTNAEVLKKFEIGAGRARFSSVGTPIEFNASTNATYLRNISFKWSFGDGSQGYGQEVVHSYAYPGEYIVVLNTSSPDGQAVSRTTASVSSADLSITYAVPERVEVSNNSKREINLYGRSLSDGEHIFEFPQDTIIGAGQKISFAADVTGIRFPARIILGSKEDANVNAEKIAGLYSELGILETRLAALSRPAAIETHATEVVAPTSVAETAAVVNALSKTSEESSANNWLEALKSFFLWSPTK